MVAGLIVLLVVMLAGFVIFICRFILKELLYLLKVIFLFLEKPINLFMELSKFSRHPSFEFSKFCFGVFVFHSLIALVEWDQSSW